MNQPSIFRPNYLIRRLWARGIKHWTPRYVIARIQLELNYHRNSTDPWLTQDAVRLLKQLLRPDDVGFEWGSGRSTIWLAERTKQLISVENDSKWYKSVSETISQKELKNVQYLFHSTDQDEETGNESEYVGAIRSCADDSLDYVLVDGWGRDWCALAAIPKLKCGGMLIVDNANWYLPAPKPRAPGSQELSPMNARWAQFLDEVSPWRPIWTTNLVTHTLILFKK